MKNANYSVRQKPSDPAVNSCKTSSRNLQIKLFRAVWGGGRSSPLLITWIFGAEQNLLALTPVTGSDQAGFTRSQCNDEISITHIYFYINYRVYSIYICHYDIHMSYMLCRVTTLSILERAEIIFWGYKNLLVGWEQSGRTPWELLLDNNKAKKQ